MRTRRRLIPAWMLEQSAGGGHPRRSTGLPRRAVPRPPGSRTEALAKLKSLFDAGVLTSRQFADERDRILGE